MRARAQLTVGADPSGLCPHRVVRMVSEAPIGWRSTPDAVYMVGTAASPVSRDDVEIEVEVGAGAALAIRSTAATVAWRGTGSRQVVRVAVEPGAGLCWTPEPLIATAGCDHAQSSAIRLAGDAQLLWSEQLVLGRHGEGAGALRSTLVVDVGGLPLLRHRLDVGPGAPGWDGGSVLGGAGAVGLVLAAGGPPCDPCQGDGWAVMPLDGPGSLGLAVSPDALHLAGAMVALRTVLDPFAAAHRRATPAGGGEAPVLSGRSPA